MCTMKTCFLVLVDTLCNARQGSKHDVCLFCNICLKRPGGLCFQGVSSTKRVFSATASFLALHGNSVRAPFWLHPFSCIAQQGGETCTGCGQSCAFRKLGRCVTIQMHQFPASMTFGNPIKEGTYDRQAFFRGPQPADCQTAAAGSGCGSGCEENGLCRPAEGIRASGSVGA